MKILILSNLISYTYNFRLELIDALLKRNNQVIIASDNDDDNKWRQLAEKCELIEVPFDGKSTAEFNADMCLFLEQWEDERSELRAYNSTQAAYKRWKEQTLAYYAANAVKCTEPEELDRDERIAKRTEFLEKEYGKSESNE